MIVRTVTMPGIERVKSQHVESFDRHIRLHHFGNVAIVPKRHVKILEATVRLLYSVLVLVLGSQPIWVVRKVLVKYDRLGPGASHRKRITDDAPLRFAIQAKTFS